MCQPDVPECASENLHKTQLNAAWFEKSNLSTKNGSGKESLVMFQNDSRAMYSLELLKQCWEFEKARSREEYIRVRENRERMEILKQLEKTV